MMNEQMQEESSEQVKKVLPMTQEVVEASDPMDGKDAQERSLAIVQNLMTDLKRIFAEKVSPKLMDDQKFLLLTDELMETGKMQCIGYRMEAGILGVSGLIAEVLKGKNQLSRTLDKRTSEGKTANQFLQETVDKDAVRQIGNATADMVEAGTNALLVSSALNIVSVLRGKKKTKEIWL